MKAAQLASSLGAALVLLSTTSCWVQSGGPRPRGYGNRSQTIDRTVTPRIRSNDGPDRVRSTGRTSIPRVNSLDTRGFAPGTVTTKPTAKGMTLAFRPRRGSTVTMNLALPHSSPTGDENGIATLSARVALESPRTASGKPSLSQSIRALGGEVTVNVDGSASHFTVTAHESQWKAALDELIDAVSSPRRDARIDDSQRVALINWSDDYAKDPVIGTVDWVAKTTDFDKHPIDGIQDLTSGHVANFQGASYLPTGGVLSIEGPLDAEPTIETATASVGTWGTNLPDVEEIAPTAPLVMRQGTYWATSADPNAVPEVAVLVAIPLLATAKEQAEALVALEHYIGPSGVLIPELRATLGESFELRSPRWITNGSSATYMVRGSLDPENAARFVQSLQGAYVKLIAREATSTDVLRAAGRARLRMLHELDAPARSTQHTARILMGKPTTPGAEIDAILTALSDPSTLDLAAGFTRIATIPPTVVVCGSSPPRAFSANITSLGRLRSSTDRAILGAGEAARESAADEFVDLAIGAYGGRAQLAQITGFIWQALVETGRGPNALEWSAFDAKGSNFRRLRNVLATQIDTLVKDGRGTEFVGDENAGMPSDEVSALLGRLEQHPLLILAETARGTTKFRLNSNREVGGRPFVVLERTDANKPRLRIHVDKESGLIRTVQTVEHLPGIGPASVTEHYRDYRYRLGVRVPFHKTTLIDGTVFGSKTTYTEVSPIAPPAVVFNRKM